MEHIHATPVEESSWPRDMSLRRTAPTCSGMRMTLEPLGFTYTVLEPGRRRRRLRLHLSSIERISGRSRALLVRTSRARSRRAPLAGGERLACYRVALENVDYAPRTLRDRRLSGSEH